MMTPVCRTNDQWTAKFRLASDPTKYASQPYVIVVQRAELWATPSLSSLVSSGAGSQIATSDRGPLRHPAMQLAISRRTVITICRSAEVDGAASVLSREVT